jgi:hypothetical protein
LKVLSLQDCDIRDIRDVVELQRLESVRITQSAALPLNVIIEHPKINRLQLGGLTEVPDLRPLSRLNHHITLVLPKRMKDASFPTVSPLLTIRFDGS